MPKLKHGHPLGSTCGIVNYYIAGVPSLPLQRFGLQSLASSSAPLVKNGHTVPVLHLSRREPDSVTSFLASLMRKTGQAKSMKGRGKKPPN